MRIPERSDLGLAADEDRCERTGRRCARVELQSRLARALAPAQWATDPEGAR
jgi:hypothetical protein